MLAQLLRIAAVTAVSAGVLACRPKLAEGGPIGGAATSSNETNGREAMPTSEARRSSASAGRAENAPASAVAGSAPTTPPAMPSTTPPMAAPVTPRAWFEDLGEIRPHDTLHARFAEPKGFVRVPLQPGSFGAFLRDLPLAPPSTDVLAYDGRVIHEATHPIVAAVVALDVGKADLQQCADSIIRLHAEWLWSIDRAEKARYGSGAGPLTFAAYLLGERHVWSHGQLVAKNVGPQPKTHRLLRRFLDEVYGVANTASLRRQGVPVKLDDLAPGDFFVMSGSPFGHAVLVLDMVRAADGRRMVLLGQGYMPAQSFHVLRQRGSPWFPVDPAGEGMDTPSWDTFPWDSLRRFGE